MSQASGFAILLFIFVASAALYMVPSIVAWQRKHQNLTGIVLLNVFLGWSIIGWVGALIWAVSKQDVGVRADPHKSRACPFCAESVLRAAVKCRHCGSDLPPVSAPDVEPAVVPPTVTQADELAKRLPSFLR